MVLYIQETMEQHEIWKERYQALYRWVENNCVENGFKMISEATYQDWEDFWYNGLAEQGQSMNDLSDLHYERISFLESEILKYQEEISLLKDQIEIISNGREYDC